LRNIGESFSGREELDHALCLSKTIRWETETWINQSQLVILAGAVASFDPSEAVRLLARYDNLKKSASMTASLKDDRFRGEELVARAAVHKALGNRDKAVLLLVDALEMMTSLRLTEKAGMVAADLAELTNNSHYLAIALKASKNTPNSILGHRMSQIEKPASAPTARSGGERFLSLV
jgi:hypothetical protein